MKLGKDKTTSRSVAVPSDLAEAVKKLNDPALQARVQAAARAAAIEQLKTDGIDLTPEQWGELTALLLTSRKKDPGDVLAGAAAVVIGIAISDIRCKTNLVRLPQSVNGIHLYEFSYNGFSTRWVGVIAQEVAQILPDAVIQDKSGVLMVDYSALGIEMMPAA